jgi:hypothetical protein
LQQTIHPIYPFCSAFFFLLHQKDRVFHFYSITSEFPPILRVAGRQIQETQLEQGKPLLEQQVIIRTTS